MSHHLKIRNKENYLCVLEENDPIKGEMQVFGKREDTVL